MGRECTALVVALALLAACAGPSRPAREAASEEERRAYHAANSLIESDPAAAERGFEDFLRRWPDGPLAPKAEGRLGDIALERGDLEEALRRFYGVVRHYSDSEISDVIRVRIAEIELDRDNPRAATKVLGRARISRLSNENKRSAYRVLASAAPDSVAKLRWLARLRVIEPDEDAVAFIDVEIDSLIVQLDERNVDRAIDQIGREIPAARLLLRRAVLALEEGDLERAEKSWKRAGSLPRAPGTERALQFMGERIELRRARTHEALRPPTFAEAMQRALPETVGAEGTLGVVLPLSGPFARFGDETLNGILLAAGVFDELADNRARARVRLVIRDSGGRPERAAEAVRELAQDESIVAIIGPLLKGECEAAGAAAEAARIPMIALTARSEVAQGRAHVFRVRTQPDQETQVLVDHAMSELGAQRFAILYPRDAYGRGLRSLFWDAVEERGGHIVGVASYDPEATDFAEPIRRLVGYMLLSEEEKALIEEREEMLRRARRLPPDEALVMREEARALTTESGEALPPIVDFDALFIPESHEKVGLIAPRLAFHEAVGAQLLGASGWYHPDLVKIGRHHVRGALFTSHYYAESPLPFVKDFTDRYVATFAAEPDALSAQAFDAANLVLVQLARGRGGREEVRDGVLTIRAYPGVSGVLSMSADGNASKRPFLLGVERGHMTQIN
jgi:ABC-type branched-subunit amino acid transport system substrate-binding protein/predicted negative regulator of RcsB-dependent stress response